MERNGKRAWPEAKRVKRGRWTRTAVLVATAALAFALVEVQVFHFERFALIAKENRLRPITVRPPRGTIYDRNGKVVAENVVGYEVLLMPAPRASVVSALERLRPVLGLSREQVGRALERYERDPHLPLPVVRDAPPIAVARLEERRYRFRGVLIREYPKRHYPAGGAVGHVVGYVAEITEQQLGMPEFRDYRQGRLIGQAGLERYYEQHLGGRPGTRYVEVDAVGRIKRWLPEEMGVPVVPGRDLQLHLDLDLQRYVVELFEQAERDLGLEDLEGAFVAIDPRTGGVLALYSHPSFDPNVFVGGIRRDVWRALNEDPTKPLLNRVTNSAQPPGSTFKLMTASMALGLDVIEPRQVMPVACTGGLRYGGRYARCWYTRGHGPQNLIQGIKNSCDVYFYQVGIRIGLERFMETGTRLGIGERTGIDLPAEMPSIFPKGLDWFENHYGYAPPENEIMSLAIGQGAITLTPLKLAHMSVALARDDRKAPAPRLVETGEEPPSAFDLPITREQLRALRRGMRRVTAPGPGTPTAALSRLQHWDFLGKTGTAENPHGDDHGWFVGIGGPKGESPEIVAVMFVAHGKHGSDVSTYVANAINFYLNRKHGRPFERHPVPRWRLQHGLPVDWDWLQSPVEDPPVVE